MNPSATVSQYKVSSKILAGAVACATIVAANVLMLAAQPVGDDDAYMPPRPAALTGVAAPTVGSDLELGEIRLVVPVLDRPELRLPELPDVERGALLGSGTMAAPEAVIEVRAPDIAVAGRETTIEAPVLRQPDLPVPPPVR